MGQRVPTSCTTPRLYGLVHYHTISNPNRTVCIQLLSDLIVQAACTLPYRNFSVPCSSHARKSASAQLICEKARITPTQMHTRTPSHTHACARTYTRPTLQALHRFGDTCSPGTTESKFHFCCDLNIDEFGTKLVFLPRVARRM